MSDEKETITTQSKHVEFTLLELDVSEDIDKILSFFDWNAESKNLNIVTDIEISRKIFFSYFPVIMCLLFLFYEYFHKKGKKMILSLFEGIEVNWLGIEGNQNIEKWKEVVSSEKSFSSEKILLPIPIRTSDDREKALEFGKKYAENLDLEYEKTLRYLVNELLYNTIEHGKNELNLPSFLQFFWNSQTEEMYLVLADIGVGIRKHLRQTYPNLVTDSEAILHAIKPQVSGTFGRENTSYETKNNAGVGLFFSSNIAQRLNADMFIVSGNGFVHISPTEIISKELNHQWKGTFVYVKIKLGLIEDLNLQKMLSEITKSIPKADKPTEQNSLYISVRNYFGKYAEDKDLAKKIRDKYILPALEENKTLTLDFEEIISAPHSLLNAMLATPIERLGLAAYKKIKIINAAPEIRETLDFIFDDNTSNA